MNLRNKIIESISHLPNREISFGVYADIGYKFVTISNHHNKITTKKVPFSAFEKIESQSFSECLYNWELANEL